MPGDGARPDAMLKRWKMGFHALKNNRKFRCGGFSVLLTAAAVICVLLFSVLADQLESRFALRLDCSFNSATTQGETTNAVLGQLSKKVHIYAIIPEDTGENVTLTALLDRYAAASSYVTVSKESIVKNPVLLTQFSDALGENAVSSDCLIISCPETGRARVLDEDDYYTYSYNTESGYFSEAGYTYEKSITEAILYVSQDELPTLQILTGHGELNEADTVNTESVLVSANYMVKRVNLQSGDALDPESPLMVLSPQYDLSESELNTLLQFAQSGGDFFFVSQYSDPLSLKNYNALLRMYGIQGHEGLVIAKESDSASYYSDSPIYLMPYMQETAPTLPLVQSGQDILLLGGARAFQVPDEISVDLSLYPVLLTGQAYIRNYMDGISLSEKQEGDPEGIFPLALWAEKMFEDGTVSKAFAIGNMTVFEDYWVQNNTASIPFLLQMIRSLQGKEPVNLDILPKNALRDNLTLGSLAPAYIVIIALPLLVALGAVLVLGPRRNL